MEQAILTVKKINAEDVCVDQLHNVLDRNGVEWNEIASVNWPNEFPAKPHTEFRIAHCKGCILLQFRSDEHPQRLTEDDNGRIWEDSCVEMFIVPVERTGNYYNLEINCGGKLLLGGGAERKGRTRAVADIRTGILRSASRSENGWIVSLVVPTDVFFLDEVPESLSGTKMRANFYKCGDLTSTPHYLSFWPIDLPSPNFHAKEFFGSIVFE